MVTESVILVIVGWVLGVATTVIERHFHRQERKSDRRREVYERQLGIVSDAVDAVMEAVIGIMQEETLELRNALIKQGHVMGMKALVVAGSIDDPKLTRRVKQLIEGFEGWHRLFDLEAGEPKEGKEEEFSEWLAQVRRAGSEVLHRKTEILE